MKSKIENVTNLITSITGLVSIVVSLLVFIQVQKTQSILDDRQIRLDENQRILNLGGKGIPVGDKALWDDYWADRANGVSRLQASTNVTERSANGG